MEEHVYPNEAAIGREDDDAQTLLEELRGRAREAGLWAPHVPPEAGGTGFGFLYYACLNEEIGRSAYAQLVFGCQAPDAGNAEILHLFGTDDQKERFLRPLVAGEVRSFFSMTEPEVAGSDPTLLRTRAVRDGDEWVVDGHKWFSSGADGAAFAIVFAISDPDAEPHRRGTMILVPADTAGCRGRTARARHGACGARLEHPLRGAVHGRAGARREHPGWRGRCLPPRPEAARPGADPPRDALARADAEGVRADVPVRERAGGVRRAARGQADGAELGRGLGRGDPGLSPADDGRRAEDRPGLGGARRGVAPQVLRGARCSAT